MAGLSSLVTSLRSESEASRELNPLRSRGQKDSASGEVETAGEEDEEDVALDLSEDEEEL